jgi:hypothetical protein
MARSQEAQTEQNGSGGLLGKIKKTLRRGLESLQYVKKLLKGFGSLWLFNTHFKTLPKTPLELAQMNYILELYFIIYL